MADDRQERLQPNETPALCPRCSSEPTNRFRWDAEYRCGTKWICGSWRIGDAVRYTTACDDIAGLRRQVAGLREETRRLDRQIERERSEHEY